MPLLAARPSAVMHTIPPSWLTQLQWYSPRTGGGRCQGGRGRRGDRWEGTDRSAGRTSRAVSGLAAVVAAGAVAAAAAARPDRRAQTSSPPEAPVHLPSHSSTPTCCPHVCRGRAAGRAARGRPPRSRRAPPEARRMAAAGCLSEQSRGFSCGCLHACWGSLLPAQLHGMPAGGGARRPSQQHSMPPLTCRGMPKRRRMASWVGELPARCMASLREVRGGRKKVQVCSCWCSSMQLLVAARRTAGPLPRTELPRRPHHPLTTGCRRSAVSSAA